MRMRFKLRQANQNTEKSDTLTNSPRQQHNETTKREKGNQALISTTTVEYTCNKLNKHSTQLPKGRTQKPSLKLFRTCMHAGVKYKMKAKRQKIAPKILAILKEIPYGKAMIIIETEDFKAPSVNRFLKRRHKRGQLREFKFVQRKFKDKTAIFITQKLNINFPFSYIG